MKKFQCDQCGEFFDFKSKLLRHLSRKNPCSKKQKNTHVAEEKKEGVPLKKIFDPPFFKGPPLANFDTINNEEEKFSANDLLLDKTNLCSYCGKKCNNKLNLEKHKSSCSSRFYVEEMIDEITKKVNSRLQLYKDKISKIEEVNNLLENKCKTLEVENKKLENEHKKTEAENKRLLNKISKLEKDNLKKEIEHLRKEKKSNNSVYNYIINNYNNAPDLQNHTLNYPSETMEQLVQLGPVDGPTELFKMHYINNVKPEDRSLWCLDIAREKCIVREEGNWILDIKGIKIKKDTIQSLKQTFESFLSEKLKSDTLDQETQTDIIHFLAQLYSDNTMIKIFKNLQGYIVYNKNELLEKYKDKVVDIDEIVDI